MKYLILVVVLLTGCSQYFSSNDYNKSVKVCSANNGVDYIYVESITFSVYCTNGAKFHLNKE